MRTERYLLDTCAIIWLTNKMTISDEVSDLLRTIPPGSGRLSVSAISAWEIGLLVTKGRLPTTKHALSWFEDFLEAVDVMVREASAKILVASSYLPQPIHNDPADRILIATAREYDLTIITRDRAILTYGGAGHVRTLEC
jgi:PIN domain nuclease of toxin-antitoxin system